MAMQYLGETLDIHGGGEDLIFPHHENEIAQSEAVTGKPFARYWMHNGFVNLGAEKMSKSLGNTLTIRELVQRHDPEAMRLYLLGTHYRNPLEFGEERVERGGAGAQPAARGSWRRRSGSPHAGTPPPGPDGGLFDEVARAARPLRGRHGRRLQQPAGPRRALRPRRAPSRARAPR